MSDFIEPSKSSKQKDHKYLLNNRKHHTDLINKQK